MFYTFVEPESKETGMLRIAATSEEQAKSIVTQLLHNKKDVNIIDCHEQTTELEVVEEDIQWPDEEEDERTIN